jgi:hypothetical protein
MRMGFRQAGEIALLLWPGAALAAEPVRQIGIYVQPFYEAARTSGGKPQVAVGKQYNDLLGSTRSEDILAARDLVVAKPALVTPMTMMVLAIRLYDVGLRDDAVFWFYVAKERYIVMSEVLDVKTQTLAQADDAVRSFVTLAGPIINGYAFCDLAKQKEQHAKAVEWVETNPYEVMFMARAPALPGDRGENAKRAIAKAKERALKERVYLDDVKTRETYYATRKQNEADVKFCWK